MTITIFFWGGVKLGVSVTLFLVKVEKNIESICMKGQGHIFTSDLIFFWVKCHAEGSCIQ